MVCLGGRTHKMVEAVEGSKPWKLHMIREIRRAAGIVPIKIGQRVTGFNPAPYAGPVEVAARFIFDRDVDGLPYPTIENNHGDADKLERNLGDALEQSGLLRNDSEIVHWDVWKRWSRVGEIARAVIVIREARHSDDIPEL